MYPYTALDLPTAALYASIINFNDRDASSIVYKKYCIPNRDHHVLLLPSPSPSIAIGLALGEAKLTESHVK